MRRAALIALVVVASLAGGLLVRGSRGSRPAAQALPLDRLEWPEGTRLRYAVEWRARTSARYLRQPLSGETDLACDLLLTSYGERDGVTRLGVELQRVRGHVVKVQGHDVLPDEAAAARALEGAQALLEIDGRGRVRSIRYPNDAPPLFRHIVQGLITETQVTLPEDPRREWTAIEAGTQARAEQRYQIDAADPWTLRREAGRLDRLTSADEGFLHGAAPQFQGRATIVVDPAGHVRSLESETSTHVTGAAELDATTRFKMERTGIERLAGPPAAPRVDEVAFDTRMPGDLVRTLSDADLDQRLAAELTAGTVEGTVDAYAHGIGMDLAWMGHATAFVRVHPDFVAVLRRKFPTTSRLGKELVFDLLSAAGSAEAQSAMRDLIQTPEARADLSMYTQLLQRFSFVRRPTAETLALLARSYREAVARKDSVVAHATVYALGAEIGARRDLGLHAMLVAELRAAKDPDERAALLAALGNAGLSDGQDPILGAAGDADDEVRAQVATSLRKYDTAPAHEGLLRLLGDGETVVAKRALASLSGLALLPAEVGRVAEMIEAGAITGSADPSLVTFARAHREAPAAAVRILRAVLARAHGRPELTNQATLALQTFASPGQSRGE